MFLVAFTIGLLPFGSKGEADAVKVFAASSLIKVLSEVEQKFQKVSSGNVKFSFAASSTLANQIARGAPSDIFISANKAWLDYLQDRIEIDKNTKRSFLLNRLVIAAHKENLPITIITENTLLALLGNGRLSIGEPTHVPAGIYGKQALQTLGLWDTVKNRLAPCSNVRAALALIERNETPIGLIYRTDALNNKNVKIIFTFPDESHDRIEYFVVIVQKVVQSNVLAFYNFLVSPDAQVIYNRSGFEIPLR